MVDIGDYKILLSSLQFGHVSSITFAPADYTKVLESECQSLLHANSELQAQAREAVNSDMLARGEARSFRLETELVEAVRDRRLTSSMDARKEYAERDAAQRGEYAQVHQELAQSARTNEALRTRLEGDRSKHAEDREVFVDEATKYSSENDALKTDLAYYKTNVAS